METTILGIDISKATFDVVLRRQGQSMYANFGNDRGGFRKLGNWLDKRKAGQVWACMEATGIYGDDLAEWLVEQGHQVSVVNPSRIKAYGQSQLLRNKTDKGDAALIADFCLTQRPALWSPPPPELRELRAMARHLDTLQQMRQQERNRLEAEPRVQPVKDSLHDHIRFLDQQIEALLQQIHDHVDHYPDLKHQTDLLTSIPGIGDLTAFKLLAEIGDFRAFETASQLVAFAGLSPRQRQSGSSVRGRTRLTKLGNANLRKALYFPALTAKRHNPIVKEFCLCLAQRGKAKMVIVGAAMRKLLVLAYGVLKSGIPFDPHYCTKLQATP
jgi:transposase